MKITKERLKQIILEEVNTQLKEFNPYFIAAAAGAGRNADADRQSTSSQQPETSYYDINLKKLRDFENRILQTVADKEFSTDEKIENLKKYKKELENLKLIEPDEYLIKSKNERIQLVDKMITTVTNMGERGKKFTGKLVNWWQRMTNDPKHWKE